MSVPDEGYFRNASWIPVFCDISIGVGGVGVHTIYCLVTLGRVYCKVLIVTNLHLIENIKTLSKYDDL
jgi:hypothetical protein